MYDIIAIGSGMRDVFLLSDQFRLIANADFEGGKAECVALGSKIEVNDIVLTTGGGATNAAVTFARLGLKTAAICRIGDDAGGRDVIEDLKKEGVATALIRRVAKGVTGYSTLLTASNGERTALTYRGVSGTLGSADVPFAKCKARWFYVTSLAGNVALARKIATHAKSSGASVAWNPGRKEIEQGLGAIKAILPNVRVLQLNKEEAARLTGASTVEEMFAALATPGNVVVITDGARGAFVQRDGITIMSPGSGRQAVSQTGAGDAFGSGFVAGLMRTDDLRTALAVGMLNAQSVITKVGAKAGILKKWPTNVQLKSVNIAKV
ncbi:MAG: carbohydrate kinase family protein [Candidatus Uhrbacteria bacterium]